MSKVGDNLLSGVITLLTFDQSLTQEFTGDAKSIFEKSDFYKRPANLMRLPSRDSVMLTGRGDLSVLTVLLFCALVAQAELVKRTGHRPDLLMRDFYEHKIEE